MKRIISKILIFTLLFMLVPTGDLSYGETINERIAKSKEYNGDMNDKDLLINQTDITVNQINSYLVDSLQINPYSLEKNYKLNPYVYQKYKKIAYTPVDEVNRGIAGLTKGDMLTNEKSSGNGIIEYRYLGYAYDEEEKHRLENYLFPVDAAATDPMTKNWITSGENRPTWDKEIKGNTELENYILRQNIIDNTWSVPYTFASILGRLGATTNDLMKDYVKVISSPSFSVEGQFRLQHKRPNGKVWYGVMKKENFDFVLEGSLTPKQSSHKIPAGQDEVIINYTVSASITGLKAPNANNTSIINDTSNSGKYFRKIEMSVLDKKEDLFKNNDLKITTIPPLTRTLSTTVDTRGFKIGDKKTIALNGTVSVECNDGFAKSVNIGNRVTIEKVGECSPDFFVYKELEDVTDGSLSVKDLNFVVPYNLSLQDNSYSEDGVDLRYWKIYSNANNKWVPLPGTLHLDTVNVDINQSNKDDYVKNGEVKFQMILKTETPLLDETGNLPSVIHKVTFAKEIPPEIAGGPVALAKANCSYYGDDKNDPDDDGYYEVMEGKTVRIDGNGSYHEKGLKLTKYEFDTSIGATRISTGKKSVSVTYMDGNGGDEFPVYLTVTDEEGNSDEDSILIKVIPAKFEPVIKYNGTFKENRKLTMTVENKNSIRYFPINKGTVNWTITPLDGQGDTVRIKSGTGNGISGTDKIDTLFKKKGRYLVSVNGYIRNTIGTKSYYGSKTEIITIDEDLLPIADFITSKTKYRDVDNNNLTDITLYDKSKSLDRDIIVNRYWYYYYDTDNDGSFADETLTYFYGGNERKVNFRTDQVGRYKFELVSVEGFGQETIDEFIVPADLRATYTGDTKPDEEKICEISNVAPVVDIEASVRKNVNLIIYTDYTEAERTEIESEIALLRGNLQEKKINLKVKYLEGTGVIGNYDRLKINYNQMARFPYYYDPDNRRREYYFSTLYESKTLWEDEAFGIKPTTVGTFPANITPSPNYNTSSNGYGLCDREYFGNVNYTALKGYSNIYYLGKSFENILVAYYHYGSNEGLHGIPRFKFQDKVTLGNFEFGGVVETQTKQLKSINPAELEILLEGSNEDNYFLSICKSDKEKIGFSESLKEKIEANNIIYRTTKNSYSPSNPLNIKNLEEVKEVEDKLYFNADGDYYVYDKSMNKIIKISEENYNSIQIKVDGPSSDEGILNLIESKDHENFDSLAIASGNISTYSWGWFDARSPTNQFENIAYLMPGHKMYSKLMMVKPSTDEQAYTVFLKGRTVWGSQDYGWQTTVTKKFTTGYKYKGYVDTKDYRMFLSENGSFHIYDYRSQGNGNVNLMGDTYTLFETIPYIIKNINIGTSDYKELAFIDTDTSSNIITIGTKTGTTYKYNIDSGVFTKIELSIAEVLDSGAMLLTGGNSCYYNGITFENAKYVFAGGLFDYKFNYNKTYQYRSYYSISITPNDELYISSYFQPKNYSYSSGWTEGVPIESKIKIADNVEKIFWERNSDPYGSTDVIYQDKEGNLIKANAGITLADGYNYERYGYGYGFKVNSLGTVNNYGNPIRASINESNLKYLTIKNGKLNILDLKAGTDTYIGADYGTLLGTDYKTLIGEKELIDISPRNQVYDGVKEVIGSVFSDYRDYSTNSKLYALLGEEIEVTTIYSDYESDPLYEKKYSETHVDPNYFENSLGKDPSISEDLENPRLKFDYVGKYQIKPHVRDNPKDDDRFDNYRKWNNDDTKVDIYVHRKPVALMNLKFEPYGSKYKVTFEDGGSYDLDHFSSYKNGITFCEFSILGENDRDWEVHKTSKFTKYDIEKYKKYKIAYRVMDKEGVWSDHSFREIYLDDNPINISAKIRTRDSYFNIMNLPITEDYEIYDIETDYSGNLKLESAIYGKNPYTGKYDKPIGNKQESPSDQTNIFLKVPKETPDGGYVVRLKAIDRDNNLKEATIEFGVGVRTPVDPVGEIKEELSSGEEIKIKCETSKYTDSVELTLYEDTIHEKKWPMTKVAENSRKSFWEKDYIVEDQVTDGFYRCKFTGTVETNPKKAEVDYKNYNLKNLGIKNAIIWGYWNHWRGQVDLLGEQLSNEPMRFLSYEKIHIEVEAIGNPDKVEVRFSPELESMSYRDEYGNLYSYRDHIGYTVKFPLKLNKGEDGKWSTEYILPLTKSSISWKNKRLMEPYWAEVMLKKGESEKKYRFSEETENGIDITGNVLDLVYIQPVE